MPEAPDRVPLPAGGAGLRGTLSPLAARSGARAARPDRPFCTPRASMARWAATSQDPQVYRDREEAKELRATRDPIELLRAKLDVSDDDFAEVDTEVTEIVEAAVEFAKSGTDPAPEDALKNIYA